MVNSTELQIARVTTLLQKQEWDEFASRSTLGNMHQCLWWAEPLRQFGVTTHVLGCWKGNRLVGGGLFRSVPIPFLGMQITECLDGPIFVEWSAYWADAFVRELQDLADEIDSVAVSIRNCPISEVHQGLVGAFERGKLKLRLTPGTVEGVVPLKNRTMEDLWKNFRRRTKRSLKKGLADPVRVAHLTSTTDFLRAYEAWISTAKRKGFPDVRPWPALEPVLRHCVDGGFGSVLGTFLGDRLLAATFVTYMGQTGCGIYAGYIDGVERYQPTHVLQYTAIEESIARGMGAYTFGSFTSDGKSSTTGVDQWKLGFGAVPKQNLNTITWERRPSWHRCIEWLRQRRLGARMERLYKEHLSAGRGGRS